MENDGVATGTSAMEKYLVATVYRRAFVDLLDRHSASKLRAAFDVVLWFRLSSRQTDRQACQLSAARQACHYLRALQTPTNAIPLLLFLSPARRPRTRGREYGRVSLLQAAGGATKEETVDKATCLVVK